MSINAISSISSAASSSTASALSEDTKKKLKALGLDPTKYTTEAQAQKAIDEAQAKEAQKTNGQNVVSSIKTEVEDLASSMGISVGKNDKINDIMSNISDKISELQASAGTDETKSAEVNDYSNKYTAISNELAQLESVRNMKGANALANYNKVALGLT